MIARWTVHISMCFTWVYALMVAALGDRPIEVFAASVAIILVPFVYVGMVESLESE